MAAPGNSLQEQSQEHKLVVVCRRPFESVLTVCVWASWGRLLCWILQRENGNSTCTLDSWSCNSSLRLSLRGCKSHKFAVLDVDLSLSLAQQGCFPRRLQHILHEFLMFPLGAVHVKVLGFGGPA